MKPNTFKNSTVSPRVAYRAPADSWWTKASSREEFDRLAAHEFESRMIYSVTLPVTASDAGTTIESYHRRGRRDSAREDS